MPNEMNHAEVAKELKDFIEFLKLGEDIQCDKVVLDPHTTNYCNRIESLESALTDARRIASGKLVPAPVKCVECKHCSQNPYTKSYYCTARSLANIVILSDFCSYGERKDGEPHA